MTTGIPEPDGSVTVLLFGSYRDLAPDRRLEMALRPGDTVVDLLGAIERRVGPLGPSPAVAVNRVYAPKDRVLAPDDEVALLPPVAGG